MGVANLAAGFTQAFPVSASGSRTAVNASVGSRTQVAGLVAARTIALILLFLTEPIKYLPTACLGAVIFVAAAGLVKLPEWRGLGRISPVEPSIALVAAVGVVLWGVQEAIAAAPPPVRWLIFDAEAMATMDATGCALLALVGELRAEGVTLLVARLKGPAETTLVEAGAIEVVGAGNLHPTVRAAVAAARQADADASSLRHDGPGSPSS